MQGWACGHCKHCATLFYQLREYIQLELKSVSDDKTCTDIFQTWHVPSESGNTGAIIFSELSFIKADQLKKEIILQNNLLLPEKDTSVLHHYLMEK